MTSKLKSLILLFILIAYASMLFAGNSTHDSVCKLTGSVKSKNSEVPFVNVVVKGTTQGVVTDAAGNFSFCNLKSGRYTLVISGIGYKTKEVSVEVHDNEKSYVEVIIDEDSFNMDEVVVSADRGLMKRTQAPVMVNTIAPALFSSTQSLVVGEALNFMPGMRLENNCQNCGFNQVRMNGMEGPYSQILINSRPIFSGLAVVYGLELLPANMIERIEVVRGGGSVLYGSNAIAGTINIILKDALINSYEVGSTGTLTGWGIKNSNGPVGDFSANFNNTLIADNNRTGITLYGFTRDRKMFDANGDGYSELAPLSNLSMGTRLWQKIGERSKLAVDFFLIQEKRDGGNKQNLPLHERDIAEAVKHDMRAGSLTFERFVRQYDLFSAYASAQYLNRDSYYGANQSLSNYGQSRDITVNTGLQYKAILGASTITAGAEITGSRLNDKKLAYRDITKPIFNTDPVTGDTISIDFPQVGNTLVSDQSLFTYGAFVQHDMGIGRFKTSVGARVEQYAVIDHAHPDNNDKRGIVMVPRISLMYNATNWLQTRLSYSQGYRAPQIFDEDLHVETSGSRQVINRNDPNLKQETSHSIMASADANIPVGNNYFGFLTELFYTRLQDPFVNEIGIPDENGTVIYTRHNATEGATVKGLNVELKFKTLQDFALTGGLTVQSSHYDAPQGFNEKRFFRTPNRYGYLIMDWDFAYAFCLSANATYTGTMLAPYFGPNTDPQTGELRKTPNFYDLGIKLSYNIKMGGKTLQFFGGVKNLLNSYQKDFDLGIDRDPSYIYGPTSPRAIYLGFKLGNQVK